MNKEHSRLKNKNKTFTHTCTSNISSISEIFPLNTNYPHTWTISESISNHTNQHRTRFFYLMPAYVCHISVHSGLICVFSLQCKNIQNCNPLPFRSLQTSTAYHVRSTFLSRLANKTTTSKSFVLWKSSAKVRRPFTFSTQHTSGDIAKEQSETIDTALQLHNNAYTEVKFSY